MAGRLSKFVTDLWLQSEGHRRRGVRDQVYPDNLNGQEWRLAHEEECQGKGQELTQVGTQQEKEHVAQPVEDGTAFLDRRHH